MLFRSQVFRRKNTDKNYKEHKSNLIYLLTTVRESERLFIGTKLGMYIIISTNKVDKRLVF